MDTIGKIMLLIIVCPVCLLFLIGFVEGSREILREMRQDKTEEMEILYKDCLKRLDEL